MSLKLTKAPFSRTLRQATSFRPSLIHWQPSSVGRSKLTSPPTPRPISSRPLSFAAPDVAPEMDAETMEVKTLSDPPAENQVVAHQGKRYTTVKEGLAYILVPLAGEGKDGLAKDRSKTKQGNAAVQQVFYNPIQQFNRDLTVLAIRAYGRERLEQRPAVRETRLHALASKKRRRLERKEANDRAKKLQKVAESTEPEPEPEPEPATGDTALSAEAAPVPAPAPAPAPVPAPVPAAPETNVANGAAEIAAASPEAPTGDALGGAAEKAGESLAEATENKKAAQFTILDALSASGLRALRYAHEIPFVTSVTANDLDKAAVEAIKRNAAHNGLESKIQASHDNAVALMYTRIAQDMRKQGRDSKDYQHSAYDVVDLDPYGSAAPFFDAAVQSVRGDGGLLCVTCTDSGVWASNGYPEKCFSLYGGVPLKALYSHEVGLRIILHGIETAAARYGLAIEPLLSLSIDFYVRVFVRVRRSPASVKFQAGKNMILYACDQGCGAWATQPLARNRSVPNKGAGTYWKHSAALGPTTNRACEYCGNLMHLAGPMYAGYLHSPDFIQRVEAELEQASPETCGTGKRIRGMLKLAAEEMLPLREEGGTPTAVATGGDGTAGDHVPTVAAVMIKDAALATLDPYPFYVFPADLSGKLHCATPSADQLRGALVGLGYRVSRSHCKPGSVKTDAPWAAVWHVMREWVRQKAPVKVESLKPRTAGYKILGLDKKGGADDNSPLPLNKENGDKMDTSNDGLNQPEGGGREDDVPGSAAATAASHSATDGPGKEAVDRGGSMPEVVFDERLGRDPDKKKYVRYQVNPRENWGPLSRAKGR